MTLAFQQGIIITLGGSRGPVTCILIQNREFRDYVGVPKL